MNWKARFRRSLRPPLATVAGRWLLWAGLGILIVGVALGMFALDIVFTRWKAQSTWP